MRQEHSKVTRQSIRLFPDSNTEVNKERLPEPKSLRGLKLSYREVPSGADPNKFALWLVVLLVVGCLYSLLWLVAPTIVLHWWTEIRKVEGLPVVASMLSVMALLIAMALLVFVPIRVLLTLGVFSFAAAFGSATVWLGQEKFGSTMLLLTMVVASACWRQSLMKHHSGWLNADPRTIHASISGLQNTSFRWTLPRFKDICVTLHGYLTYGASQSGAVGVWIAPSALSVRVLIAATLAASSVAFFARIGFAFSGSQPVAVLAGACIFLVAVAGWTLGEASGLSSHHASIVEADARSLWRQNVDRLCNSEHVAIDPISGGPVYEAEHLFLGWEPWQNFPILLHRPLIYEHAYIVGRSGAGKTSMGLMQLMIQLIGGHRADNEIGWIEKSPVIIVDLKGDEVLFQTAKKEAERRGQKFRFFTLEPGRATFRFNPFSGFLSGTRTISQLVHLVLDTLSLYHGVGYGRGYYSQRSRFFLSQALAVKSHNSFEELYGTLIRLYGAKKEEFRDAFELLSVIESLTHYWQLVTTQQEDNDSDSDVIRMDRVLEDCEVVYFWLPSAKESAAVATVGKLVLFNLQTAAHDRKSEGKPKRQAFLIIDEFQKLASENFQQILQQARSAGIAAILANQSVSDLKTPDWDLGPTIQTNTRIKMFFSLTDPEDLRTIGVMSGDELHMFGADDSEGFRPRLSVMELLALSDHPKRLLLQVTSGSGYTQFAGLPIPVQTDWPISKSESDESLALPWPTSPMPQSALHHVRTMAALRGAAPKASRPVLATTSPSKSRPTIPHRPNNTVPSSLVGKTQRSPIPPHPQPKTISNAVTPAATSPSEEREAISKKIRGLMSE